MMTPAEVHLLTDRRIAAIRWTIDSLARELAKLEADRDSRIGNAVADLPRDCMDSRKSDVADS
jgi:hypothetical protein